MDGKVFNSSGVHVAIVRGPTIFDLKGKKLYDLRGINIYKLSGELVGHLANGHAADIGSRGCRDTSGPRPIFRDQSNGPSAGAAGAAVQGGVPKGSDTILM
jgi:hypothetical protein